MAKKIRYRWNALMSFILSLFGFGTFSCGMYGVPSVTYDVSGTVTNTDNEPLQNIQVVIHGQRGFYQKNDTLYTNKNGRFQHRYYVDGLKDSQCIVTATDTTGHYEKAAFVTDYIYVNDGVPFSAGTGYADINIQMKEKE